MGLDLLINFRTGIGIGTVLSKAYRLFIPPCLGLALGLDLLIVLGLSLGWIGAVLSKAYRFNLPPCLGLAFGPRPPNHF